MTIGNGLQTLFFWREQGRECLHCHNLAIPPNIIFRDTGAADGYAIFLYNRFDDLPIIFSQSAPGLVVGSVDLHVLSEDGVDESGNGGVDVSKATDHQRDAVIQLAADVGLLAVDKCLR